MNQTQVTSIPACSSETARRFDEVLQLIGDVWTLRIVDALTNRELRFCEIERALGTSNPATLSKRLKRLEEAGVVTRHKETVDKQSVTYSLTDKGHGVLAVISAIHELADQHFS